MILEVVFICILAGFIKIYLNYRFCIYIIERGMDLRPRASPIYIYLIKIN